MPATRRAFFMPVFALFILRLNWAQKPPDFILGPVKGFNNRLSFFNSIVFPILLSKFKSERFKSPILFSLHPFFLCKEFDKILIETATRFVVSNFFEKNQKTDLIQCFFCCEQRNRSNSELH